MPKKIGLIENMRNEFPKVWDLYKQLKSLDWDENEIDILPCRTIAKLVQKICTDEFEIYVQGVRN